MQALNGLDQFSHLDSRLEAAKRGEALKMDDLSADELRYVVIRLQAQHRERDEADQRAEQVRRFMSEASQLLASSLDYETTLGHIAQLAIPYITEWCIIDLFDEQGVLQQVSVAHHDPDVKLIGAEARRKFLQMESNPALEAARTAKSVLIRDVTEELLRLTAPDEEALNVMLHLKPRSLLFVPLKVRDRVLGVISFNSSQAGRFYTDEDVALAEELAERFALALDNALLFKQAGEAAVLAERQRLSRDLHDAVTQMLFSSSVISEVLPRLMNVEEDRTKLTAHIERLQRLNRGALAEMRNLLIELRDVAETIELTVLLSQLGQATMGRTEAEITIQLDKDHGLPQPAQIIFYRIAQEAIQNAVRHAHALRIGLSLTAGDGQVTMTIEDNGRGFDREQVAAAQVGLILIEERAASINANVTIESAPDQGTKVIVRWAGEKS